MGFRPRRAALGEIVQLVLNDEHAASGCSGLILCLVYSLACCVRLSFHNKRWKTDEKRWLRRTRIKGLLVLQIFQYLISVELAYTQRPQFIGDDRVVESYRDVRTRGLDTANVLLGWSLNERFARAREALLKGVAIVLFWTPVECVPLSYQHGRLTNERRGRGGNYGLHVSAQSRKCAWEPCRVEEEESRCEAVEIYIYILVAAAQKEWRGVLGRKCSEYAPAIW